jgi:4-amino-4-deoxy-L-arabinose transferase-like glycosyltransferase
VTALDVEVMRKTRAIIWLLAVSHGLLWAAATPLWEGFDEPFHYGYVQHLALNRRLPVFGHTPVSEEIRISFENAPLSRVVNSNFGGRYTAFERYWQLPESERLQRQENLARLPAEAAYQTADSSVNPALNNYEVHQPPLYYFLASLLYLPLADAGLLTRVLALRLFSLSIGLIAVALSFRVAERLWLEPAVSISVPLTLSLLPMFFSATARISNDCLAVALFSALLLATLRLLEAPALPRRALTVGILLGLGLLTKAYFLTAVPAFAVILLPAATNRKQAVLAVARIMLAAVLLSGWWYGRNLALYGNISGMQEVTLNASPSLAQRIGAIGNVPWTASIATMVTQHIWVGNSSFIGLSRPLYQTAYAIIGCAFAGLLVAAVRRRMP